MRMVGRRMAWGLLVTALFVVISGCGGVAQPAAQSGAPQATVPPQPVVTQPVVTQPDSQAPPPEQAGAAGLSPAAFLQAYDLQTKGEPERFPVQVPISWAMTPGDYPSGLFWALANVYSRDAGLDLALLQGQTVTAWRMRLADGLPGDGPQSRYSYPSNVVLLVRDEKVLGAWLAFNLYNIGPSVKRRDLETITGLTFEQWVEREGLFADAGPNADLARLGPAEVMDAFFAAINRGDKRRAYACLTPAQQLTALTVNLGAARLYNPEFDSNNSIVENIAHGRLISYRMMDPVNRGTELKSLGDRTAVVLAAEVEIAWRQKEFNPSTGTTLRFATMVKGPGGWKLDGLGTGP